MVENALSAKINEGPLLRSFSLPEKTAQGQLLIACGSYCENSESLLLAHPTLSTKIHEYLTQRDW